MNRSGHKGIALLVYAPVVYLLPVDDFPMLALWGLVLMLGLSSLPDIDQKISRLPHRGPTHTLLFAVTVGAVLGAVAMVVGGMFITNVLYRLLAVLPAAIATLITENFAFIAERYGGNSLGIFTFVIAVLGIVSHLLGDVLTPMGIRPLWPLTKIKFSFGLRHANNRWSNPLLFFVGWLAILVAVVSAFITI